MRAGPQAARGGDAGRRTGGQRASRTARGSRAQAPDGGASGRTRRHEARGSRRRQEPSEDAQGLPSAAVCGANPRGGCSRGAGGHVRGRGTRAAPRGPQTQLTPAFALRRYGSSRPAKATRGHAGACHHPASGRALRTLEDTSAGSSTRLCIGSSGRIAVQKLLNKN